MGPDISVVIPTFNRSHLMRKVLPSYLDQPETLEVIVVDSSTDPAHKKDLQDAAAREERISLIQAWHEGPLKAKNTAVQRAKGQFVFFGEDDLLLPSDHFAVLLAHRERTNADIIGGRKIWLRDGETIPEALAIANTKRGQPFDTFFMTFHSDRPGEEDQEAPFLQFPTLVDKKVFQSLRFDEGYDGFIKGYTWREETDFYMMANEAGFRVIFCPHTAAFNLFVCSGSGSHTFPVFTKEAWVWKNNWYLLKKHKDFIRKKLKNRYPLWFLAAAYGLSRFYGHVRNLLWHLKRFLGR